MTCLAEFKKLIVNIEGQEKLIALLVPERPISSYFISKRIEMINTNKSQILKFQEAMSSQISSPKITEVKSRKEKGCKTFSYFTYQYTYSELPK
jgi:hypothetical protein